MMKTMKKMQIWLTGALAVLLLLSPQVACAAQDDAEDTAAALPRYMSVQGTVAETSGLPARPDAEPAEHAYVMLDTEGGQVKLMVMPGTYLANLSERPERGIAPGMAVTAWFDTTLPAPMIYPPQYAALALVAEMPVTYTATLDLFDDALISDNGLLKLDIDDTVAIIVPDGTPYEGDLAGKTLLALYTVSTRSIPAQATPEQVVVLD